MNPASIMGGGGMSSSNQDHTAVSQETGVDTGVHQTFGGITRTKGIESAHIAIAAVAVAVVVVLLKN